LNTGIFKGDTINTPSLLCVEDYLDALAWAEQLGLEGLIARSRKNIETMEAWVNKTDWVDFLAESREIRSTTSVCLQITDTAFQRLSRDAQLAFVKDIAGTLSRENIAHDISSYKDAPPGFRLWGGPTIEVSDIERALRGLDETVPRNLKELS
jgi:phosphoserine aminotransferase